MLKKHMAACLVASAFITMPVLAQTGTSPGATSPGATQPATGASGGAAGAGSGSAASGASGRFINQQQTTQWRASRLIGLDVYGADNNKIGDINEVLVDRQGNADAVVIGVGGFLGIGEKNVALPFNAFEWAMDDTRRTASAGGSGTGAGGSGAGGAGSGAGAGMGTAGTTGSGATGTTATTGAGTGAAGTAGASRSDTTASTSAAGGSGGSARSGAERGYPDHAVLRMTKADIENAPTFTYVGESRSESGGAARTGSGAGGGSGSGSGGGSATGGGTAPRQ